MSADDVAPAPSAATRPRLVVDTSGRVREWSLETTGLPALSADGRRVVYVGGVSGPPDIASDTVIIRSVASDRQQRVFPIFVPSELVTADEIMSRTFGASQHDTSVGPSLDMARKRVARNVDSAERALTAERWAPMERAQSDDNNDYRTTDGYSIAIVGTRFIAKDATGRMLIDRPTKAWDVPPIALRPHDPVDPGWCHFEVRLGEVYVAPANKILLVQIDHAVTGSDACDTPGQVHVMSWK